MSPRLLPRVAVLVLLAATVGSGRAPAQVSADQAADMLLTGAQRAYNEKNYPFAAARFREFLAKHGGHKNAAEARYGLALALLDGPDKDYAAALEQLQPLAGNKEFSQYPHVLYYLGLCQRGLGLRELAQATAKPGEAAQRRAGATQRFDEAAKRWAEALPLLTARAQAPLEHEWAARVRCDLAEMYLRTNKAREALATATPFLQDPGLNKSRYRGQGVYCHGFASFLLQDHRNAGRSLSTLAPFTDPGFGTHARYLLARIHHQADERAEAAGHYDGLLAEFARQKQTAAESLKQPDRFKNDPEEKARLEALVRDAPPEHVARATFYLGVLQYEDGRFADALARFGDFVKQFPGSPLAAEAQLRLGFCQVHGKQFADALKTLQPLADKEPRLADQTLFWIGKAQAGAADPNNAAAYEQAVKTALDTYRRAAQAVPKEADAATRRGEILLELADTQQLVRQYKEAAGVYQQILQDKLLPERQEESAQRRATALHLAGEYAAADEACQIFQQTYPKSTLLPAVLFRYAENAAFQAQAVDKGTAANRAQELARLHAEAAKRYRVVVEKYPEFAHVNLARYGLATALYRQGDLEKAKTTLESVPPPERAGELALVPYLLADCLMRLAPTRADDALAAGRLEEQLKGAADLLDGFAAAQPNAAQAPDALLKLGLCHQRLSALMAQPPEKAKSLAAARAAYERLLGQFGKHALAPQAILERAKCLALVGDRQGAINELQRFTTDPLRAAPVAPLALINLATLLRGQNRAAEAVTLLAQGRPLHEPSLARDPERAPWAAALHYQHGMALKESGRLPEARAVFEQLAKQFPGKAEAGEAVLRIGQCLMEEATPRLEAARKAKANARKPEEVAAASKTYDESLKSVQDAVRYLETQAEQFKPKATSEVYARLLYEAAWGNRTLAEGEVAKVRDTLQRERHKQLTDEAAKKTPAGRMSPALPVPEVPLKDVPLQPAERQARAQYQTLATVFSDIPLGTDARFELAELFGERGEHDAAVKLLHEALDKEPPADVTDQIRIRLGVCLFNQGDHKAALTQFNVVAQNPKSAQAGQAYYRSGECLMQAGQWAEAAKQFAVFRDQPPFQNLPGLSDRALLRLGHALARANQWEPSRQAHEALVARFGNSPWVHEARYGAGWAWQNLKQYDNAVNLYQQVTAHTAAEIAAKAHLQMGLCRLEQKRYADAAAALLIVPHTFDYPELSAAALCEAGRAFAELKQPEQAARLYQRVLRDHAASKWAEVAKERLAGIR